MGKFGDFFKKTLGVSNKIISTQIKVGAQVLAPMFGLPPSAGAAVGNAVANFLPGAPPKTQEGLMSGLAGVLAAPPTDAAGQQEAGSTIKNLALGLGLEPNLASIAGSLAHGMAALTPTQGTAALNAATSELQYVDPAGPGPANSFSKEDVKTIVNGAVKGAKDGALGAFLDETETGKQTVKDATNQKIEDSMPMILLAVVVCFALYASGALGKIFGRR